MDRIKDYQKVIYNEIKQKSKSFSATLDVKGIILSLPMGYGKTYLTLYGIFDDMKKDLEETTGSKLYMIVCSKTLIGSWETEINKFGFDIKYEILHSSHIKDINDWTPKPTTNIIITTPEVVSKSYNLNNVEPIFKRKKIEITRRFSDGNLNHYDLRDTPYAIGDVIINDSAAEGEEPRRERIIGERFIHAVKFERVIIDEFHNYTTISSLRSQALASVCSKDTWLLSGTPFQEINEDRVLGALLLLKNSRYRDLREMSDMIKQGKFEGFKRWSVIRKNKTPPGEKLPELISKINSFDLSREENIIYRSLQDIIKILYIKYMELKEVDKINRDVPLMKKISGNLLAMITYLRQSLIIPQIAIIKIISKMNDLDSDDIIEIINNVLEKYKLKEWIDSEESLLSSRIKKLLEILSIYPDGNIIIFSSFVEGLEVVKGFVEKTYPKCNIFGLNSKMSMDKRRETVEKFNDAKSHSIIFLSYQIGSEGLNLQSANVVINLDFYWNQGKEDQSLARMHRIGQKNDVVFQHIVVSNTGIEKSILEKKRDKLMAIDKVMTDNPTDDFFKEKKSKMSFKNIAEIISVERSIGIIEEIRKIKYSDKSL